MRGQETLSWFSVIVLLGVLQGIILFFAIINSKKGNRKANYILSGYILIIVLTLLGRFFYKFQPLTLFYFKILYVGDIIIFLFGPMLYFYLLSLFDIKNKLNIKNWVHFLPLVAFIILMFPLILAGRTRLQELIDHYYYVFIGIELFAISQNLFYLVLNSILLKQYLYLSSNEISEIPKINFYKVLLVINATGMFFWMVSFLMRFIDPLGTSDYLGYQMVWLVLSCSVIALGYYTLSNPEALWNLQNQKKYETKLPGIENIDELSVKLDLIMKESKPYLKPKLSLSELSQISGINTHLLSRIINEKFNRNFFEFVNYYRIEEFKSQLSKTENNNLTFLAIAYQVGFNSKTTFNTAFKKIVKKTPREYFKLDPSRQ